MSLNGTVREDHAARCMLLLILLLLLLPPPPLLLLVLLLLHAAVSIAATGPTLKTLPLHPHQNPPVLQSVFFTTHPHSLLAWSGVAYHMCTQDLHL